MKRRSFLKLLGGLAGSALLPKVALAASAPELPLGPGPLPVIHTITRPTLFDQLDYTKAKVWLQGRTIYANGPFDVHRLMVAYHAWQEAHMTDWQPLTPITPEFVDLEGWRVNDPQLAHFAAVGAWSNYRFVHGLPTQVELWARPGGEPWRQLRHNFFSSDGSFQLRVVSPYGSHTTHSDVLLDQVGLSSGLSCRTVLPIYDLIAQAWSSSHGQRS